MTAPARKFKITYSTLGSPDPALHTTFDEALAKVRTGFGATHGIYINGQWRPAKATFPKNSPVDTRLVMGHFHDGTPADIDEAVAAARAAFPIWRAVPWQERVRILRIVAERISDQLFELAAVDTFEVGKNRLEALGDVEETADFIRIYCDMMEKHNGFVTPQLSESERHHNRSVLKPYGVWAVIAPFNFPIALSGGPTGAALVTGNTVVLKPAEDTPYTPTLFAKIVSEVFAEEGVPAGVFNYVTGGKPTGKALAEHPDVAGITFTGSYAVGMQILRSAATAPHARPVLAEMGGKNAALVMPSANLQKAAKGVARSAFGLQGQKCSACSRVFVANSIKQPFLDLLVKETAALTIGDPTQAGTWMGPVSTAKAYEAYKRHAADLKAHATLLTGGQTLDTGTPGYYVTPTIVTDLPADHPIWRTELFLPIVAIAGFDDPAEAMQRINDVDYGLTSGIYTEEQAEIDWFFENVETGVTYANRESGATTGAWPGYQPFGGWKGSSTTGRGSGGPHYLQQYLREQSQTIVR